MDMRREWEPLLKSVLEPIFARAGAVVQSGAKVGARELEIDFVVRCDASARKVLAETSPFGFFVGTNLVEAKLMDDRFTVAELWKAAGRACLFCGKEPARAPNDVQTVVLCSRRPRAALNWLSTHIGFVRIAEGHYRLSMHPAMHVLVLTELPVEPNSFRLLLFTTECRRRDVLVEIIRHGDTATFIEAYDLYPDEAQEAIQVAKTHLSLPEFLIQEIGREEVLGLYTARDIVEYFPARELVRQIPPEELAAGLTAAQRAKLRRLLDGDAAKPKPTSKRK
jgi:hypothetical protein